MPEPAAIDPEDEQTECARCGRELPTPGDGGELCQACIEEDPECECGASIQSQCVCGGWR